MHCMGMIMSMGMRGIIMAEWMGLTPSPTLPARGRVLVSACGTIGPQPPPGTSPLAGEVGRGVAKVARGNDA
jgi:hypothetical protein